MELPVVNACNRCTALCCRYVAVEIDAPEDDTDFDHIRWYVSHENVQVYEDVDGAWYLQFFTRCRHLGAHNECTIWPDHYDICKEYEVRNCEFTLGQGGERRLFRTPEEVDRYVESRRQARRRRTRGPDAQKPSSSPEQGRARAPREEPTAASRNGGRPKPARSR